MLFDIDIDIELNEEFIEFTEEFMELKESSMIIALYVAKLRAAVK